MKMKVNIVQKVTTDFKQKRSCDNCRQHVRPPPPEDFPLQGRDLSEEGNSQKTDHGDATEREAQKVLTIKSQSRVPNKFFSK